MSTTPSRIDPDGDRAISPVLGVAILVGVTIVLASLIGAFVFGVVSLQDQPSPDLSFVQQEQNFSTDGANAAFRDPNMTTVEIRHRGGDVVKYRNLELRVSGNRTSDITDNTSVYDIDYEDGNSNDNVFDPLNTSNNSDNRLFEPGEQVRIALYAVDRSQINSAQISSYDGFFIEFDNGAKARKLQSGDVIKLVWVGGDSGTVLRRYEVV